MKYINNYDVVIVSNIEDLTILNKSIKYIIQNLNPKNIIIICQNNTNYQKISDEAHNIIYIDEDKVYPGMTSSAIKKLMYELSGSEKRAGWYFQQFLKMSYALICNDTYYLIWDADTLPLTEISFVDNSNRLFFTMKTEYNKPYFDTIKNLFGYNKMANGSFVAEHMIIEKNIMSELIYNIENNTNLNGRSFYEKILCAIDRDQIEGSGFSEFETYGTYVLYNHIGRYQQRKLRTCRNAKVIIDETLNEDILNWAKKSYDIISIKDWTITSRFLKNITQKKIIRAIFPMRLLYTVGRASLIARDISYKIKR